MERSLFWGFPNTYTYTKALGEQIVARLRPRVRDRATGRGRVDAVVPVPGLERGHQHQRAADLHPAPGRAPDPRLGQLPRRHSLRHGRGRPDGWRSASCSRAPQSPSTSSARATRIRARCAASSSSPGSTSAVTTSGRARAARSGSFLQSHFEGAMLGLSSSSASAPNASPRAARCSRLDRRSSRPVRRARCSARRRTRCESFAEQQRKVGKRARRVRAVHAPSTITCSAATTCATPSRVSTTRGARPSAGLRSASTGASGSSKCTRRPREVGVPSDRGATAPPEARPGRYETLTSLLDEMVDRYDLAVARCSARRATGSAGSPIASCARARRLRRSA